MLNLYTYKLSYVFKYIRHTNANYIKEHNSDCYFAVMLVLYNY